MLEAELSEDEVKRIYGEKTWFYDFWANLTESKAREIALEKSEIRDGMKILEVAIGTGVLFEGIVNRNPNGQNTGIDLTEGMLERAKRRLSDSLATNYKLSIGNALALDFEDDEFDLLFNCYMLDLLLFTKIDVALDEFRRVLKPSGRLILINMTEGKSARNQVYKTLYKISPHIMGGCRPLQMAEKVLEKGFEAIYSEYVEEFLFPSEIILAKKTQIYKPKNENFNTLHGEFRQKSNG